MNLCPTTPVAPKIPIGILLFIRGLSRFYNMDSGEPSRRATRRSLRKMHVWADEECGGFHVRATPELPHERMGHHCHRTRQAARRVGHASSGAASAVVCGNLRVLSGERKQNSPGSNAAAHGCRKPVGGTGSE